MDSNDSNLEMELEQFTGSECVHRYSPLFPKVVLTGGALYLAEKAGAYWLMDLIASWQIKEKVRREPFQVWTLKLKKEGGASVRCDDGNKNVLARQAMPYTSFPLKEIKLYAAKQDDLLIIMLPSEY